MSDVDAYASRVDPKLRRQFDEIRSIVRKALPGASEAVKWGVPYYSLDGVGVASMADYSGHVNLYFLQGAKLSSRLLEGTGKGMRHITVRTLDEIEEPEFVRLLKEAGELAVKEKRPKRRRA
jgi:hypothetical protein